jgi:DNA-directed RNA polymerase subunit beta
LDNTIYLSAEEEENQLIAQANIPYDKGGKITSEKVIARDQADFQWLPPTKSTTRM